MQLDHKDATDSLLPRGTHDLKEKELQSNPKTQGLSTGCIDTLGRGK